MLISLDYRTVSLDENDESKTLDVKTLSNKDYQKVLKVVFKLKQEAGEDVENNPEVVEGIFNEEVETLIQKILPKYATNLKGFQVTEGGTVRDITLEEFTTLSPCYGHAFNALMQIFKDSSLKKEDEKKS
jgi:RNase adaptor protein for sRNA GlmZ degradation